MQQADWPRVRAGNTRFDGQHLGPKRVLKHSGHTRLPLLDAEDGALHLEELLEAGVGQSEQ